MKLTTKPTAISSQPTRVAPAINSSYLVKISSVLAPIMVGTARKKENSAAVLRLMPMASAPMMVAPERLTPGTIARHWAKPTASTFPKGSSATPRPSSRGLAVRSIAMIAKPPIISAQGTIPGLPSMASKLS